MFDSRRLYFFLSFVAILGILSVDGGQSWGEMIKANMKFKLYPEEQIGAENCAKDCTKDERNLCSEKFQDLRKKLEKNCKEFCWESLMGKDCNENKPSKNWRKEIIKEGNKFSEGACNAHCDSLKGKVWMDPPADAVNPWKVKVEPEDCYKRCQSPEMKAD